MQVLQAVEAKSFRLFTLRDSFEQYTPAEVVVEGTLYPGVVFESHGRYYDIKTEKKQVVITFNEKLGQIEERPLAGRPAAAGLAAAASRADSDAAPAGAATESATAVAPVPVVDGAGGRA